MRQHRKKSVEKRQEQYRVLYSKAQQKKDEQAFDNAARKNQVDWQSFQRLMIKDICTNTKILETGCIGKVNVDQAIKALRNPRYNWRVLMELSEQLMHVSPHYYRLNSLFSNMALFCWGLDLYDVRDTANIDTVKKTYAAVAARLENMHLKHEFGKVMKYLPYQDIYCGLIVESTTDFFIQKIDYNICKLHQVQDGLYNFRIDLAKINPKEITAYPDYVQDVYAEWYDKHGKDERKLSTWYLPPADKQICIKMNGQWTFPYPMLIGLIKDLLDLDIYKQLKLQSARTDNYKAILVKVPIDERSVDKPLLTPDTLAVFAEINRESINDDIGLVYTLGSDGAAINFKNSSDTRNCVSEAVNELYDASGETRELFNGSSSGTAVKFSVENDAGFVYAVYRQFERWVNRYIKLRKYNKSTFKFSFYLLDITIFNRDDVSKRYKDACTLGATVIDKWMASLDMTPSRVLGSYVVHKDIFDFSNNFVPLSSSFNGSADSSAEPGRPTNESKGETLDVEGEKTADGEKHDI